RLALLRKLLSGGVARAVSPERHSPPEPHHPSPEALPIDAAYRHAPAVEVAILRLACDHAVSNPHIKDLSCLLPAAVVGTAGIGARLATLRGINAEQAYAPAVDLQGVAVDDRRSPDDEVRSVNAERCKEK